MDAVGSTVYLLLILTLFHNLPQGVLAAPAECALTEDSTGTLALHDLTVSQALSKLCSREITAVEYSTALIARAEEFKCLNGFAAFNQDKVLEDAAAIDAKYEAGHDIRPLCGLPMGVKDMIDVLGYPTTAGTPALDGYFPRNSSSLILKFQAANGIVFGKTRPHELASGSTGISPYYGATLNPYNNLVHVGGSSGASGAVVGARIVPAAFCSDTSRSCRNPAAMNGAVGWRGSVYCWETGDGIQNNNPHRDVVGVITRSVADVVLLDKVMTSCRYRTEYDLPVDLKGLRLGFPTQYWESLEESQGRPIFERALSRLRKAGVEIVEFDYSMLLDISEDLASVPLWDNFVAPRELARYLYRNKYNVSVNEIAAKISHPAIKTMKRWTMTNNLDDPNDQYTPQQIENLFTKNLPIYSQLYESYFSKHGFDAYIGPQLPGPATPIWDSEPYADYNGKMQVYPWTPFPETMIKAPGIAIPIGLTEDGRPLGLQITAQYLDDARLLSIATAVEKIMPSTPPPPSPPDMLWMHSLNRSSRGCLGWDWVSAPG